MDEKGRAIARGPLKHRAAVLAACVLAGYGFYKYDTTKHAIKGMGMVHDHLLEYIDKWNQTKRMQSITGDSSVPGG